MKKLNLLIMSLAFSSALFSQNNTFPTNGNVGIRTTNPQYPLDVNGNLRVTDTVFTSGIVVTQQIHSDSAVVGTVNSVTTTTSGTATIGGMLGLGTLFPNARLDVNGNANVNGIATIVKIQTSRITPLNGDSEIHFGDSSVIIGSSGVTGNFIGWNSVGTFHGLAIGNNSTASGFDALAIGHFTSSMGTNSIAIGMRTSAGNTNSITIGAGGNNFPLNNNIANSLAIGFNSTVPTLFIGPSNGIGLTANVEIGRGIGKVYIGDAQSPDLNGGEGYLGFNAARNFNSTWTTKNNGADNGASVIYSNYHGTMYFACIPGTGSNDQTITDNTVFNNVKMTIDPSGNVGIGHKPCTNAEYKLIVDGKIGAREIKVTLVNWPDYVFEKDHKLLPLDQYEVYLMENKHLYDFPSANELMNEGGLELGKMQVKQTEKLEELYLYVIELNKKNELLAKEVELLRSEMEKMKK